MLARSPRYATFGAKPSILLSRPITAAMDMGDGALVEFGSVVDAVECALSMQRAMGKRNLSAEAAFRTSQLDTLGECPVLRLGSPNRTCCFRPSMDIAVSGLCTTA